MVILITIIHVIVCLFLVVVVLLQSGKAADLAGAFGGMGSQTVFGPRGSATVLSKATTIAAALFMVTSLTLSIHGDARRQGVAVDAGQGEEAGPGDAARARRRRSRGQTVPITVTPVGRTASKAPTQTIPVPVAPAPQPNQTKK